jgi:hypothetical protein
MAPWLMTGRHWIPACAGTTLVRTSADSWTKSSMDVRNLENSRLIGYHLSEPMVLTKHPVCATFTKQIQ